MVEFRSRLSYGSAGVPERDRAQRTGGRGCARYNWRCPDRSGSDKAVRSAGIRSRSCVKLALLVGKPCKFVLACPVKSRQRETTEFSRLVVCRTFPKYGSHRL